MSTKIKMLEKINNFIDKINDSRVKKVDRKIPLFPDEQPINKYSYLFARNGFFNYIYSDDYINKTIDLYYPRNNNINSTNLCRIDNNFIYEYPSNISVYKAFNTFYKVDDNNECMKHYENKNDMLFWSSFTPTESINYAIHNNFIPHTFITIKSLKLINYHSKKCLDEILLLMKNNKIPQYLINFFKVMNGINVDLNKQLEFLLSFHDEIWLNKLIKCDNNINIMNQDYIPLFYAAHKEYKIITHKLMINILSSYLKKYKADGFIRPIVLSPFMDHGITFEETILLGSSFKSKLKLHNDKYSWENAELFFKTKKEKLYRFNYNLPAKLSCIDWYNDDNNGDNNDDNNNTLIYDLTYHKSVNKNIDDEITKKSIIKYLEEQNLDNIYLLNTDENLIKSLVKYKNYHIEMDKNDNTIYSIFKTNNRISTLNVELKKYYGSNSEARKEYINIVMENINNYDNKNSDIILCLVSLNYNEYSNYRNELMYNLMNKFKTHKLMEFKEMIYANENKSVFIMVKNDINVNISVKKINYTQCRPLSLNFIV